VALLVAGCAQSSAPAHVTTFGPVQTPSVASQPLPEDEPPSFGSQTQALTGITLDAKLLVLSADGKEADLASIKQALDYLGTPYTVWIASSKPGGLNASVLASGAHGFYQGVILTTAALTKSSGAAGLTTAEWNALYSYESNFGVRQVNWYAFPTAALGFGTPVSGGDTTSKPVKVTATTAGRAIFADLNAANPLTVTQVWAYLAPPSSDASITPLLMDGTGHALAIEQKYTDGRDWITLTADSNQYTLHSIALSYGLVNWVTKGLFIGERHGYIGVQIDDLFLASDIWNGAPDYRITPKDLDAALAWQQARGQTSLTPAMRLNFAFNGAGAYEDGAADSLADEAKKLRTSFNWISHTYEHEELDAISYSAALRQFTRNNTVASQFMLSPYSVLNLVPPGITGLKNSNAMRAEFDAGIRFLVSDTSQPGQDNPTPNAGIYNALQPSILEIPRRPTNLYYNVWTPTQWASEYNSIYRSYWGRNLTVNEIINYESDLLVLYMLRWEMDPWMFHQANLGLYDGQHALLTTLLDAALQKYSAIVTTPLLTLKMDELGQRMADKMKLNKSSVRGTITPGVSMQITVTNAANVPVTGLSTAGAETYAGQQISHVPLTAGQSVTIPLN